VIGSSTGERISPVRLGGPLAVGFVVLSSSQTVRAADGDLQRALLESGCVQADTTTTLNKGKLVIYRASCLGSSHKVIELTCFDGRCEVSAASTERDDSDRLD
jgi:hypothetical protein